jgi:hypothetical protein
LLSGKVPINLIRLSTKLEGYIEQGEAQAKVKIALKVLYIKQLGLPTACKSLQIVANFGTNVSTLLATPFSGFYDALNCIARNCLIFNPPVSIKP